MTQRYKPFLLNMFTMFICRSVLSMSQNLDSIRSSRRSKMSNSLFTFSGSDGSAWVQRDCTIYISALHTATDVTLYLAAGWGPWQACP